MAAPPIKGHRQVALPEALEDPRHIAEADHQLGPGPEGSVQFPVRPAVHRRLELDRQDERFARHAALPFGIDAPRREGFRLGRIPKAPQGLAPDEIDPSRFVQAPLSDVGPEHPLPP